MVTAGIRAMGPGGRPGRGWPGLIELASDARDQVDELRDIVGLLDVGANVEISPLIPRKLWRDSATEHDRTVIAPQTQLADKIKPRQIGQGQVEQHEADLVARRVERLERTGHGVASRDLESPLDENQPQ